MREAVLDAVFSQSRRTEFITAEVRKKSIQWDLPTIWSPLTGCDLYNVEAAVECLKELDQLVNKVLKYSCKKEQTRK